jgi:hypothetical protein
LSHVTHISAFLPFSCVGNLEILPYLLFVLDSGTTHRYFPNLGDDMKPYIIRAAIVSLLICSWGAPGCHKDALGPEPNEIVGVWHTTKIEFVSKEGLGMVEVAKSGWKGTLTLNADRSGELLMEPQGFDSWRWSGQWEIDGDLFRIAGQGADIRLEKGTLQLSGFDGVYDFNNDSDLERAKFNLVLVKQ